MHYLDAARNTERYEPYLALIGDSAKAVGVAKAHADNLASRSRELTPWPDAIEVIAKLAATTKIGVITNYAVRWRLLTQTGRLLKMRIFSVLRFA